MKWQPVPASVLVSREVTKVTDRENIDELPEREVVKALMSGEDLASISVLERDGELGSILRVGPEATATVKFRLSGDAEPRMRVLPVLWVVLLHTKSATIDEISAPDRESWGWTAAAKVIAEQTLPAGLLLPQPLRRRKLWLLTAHDDRGYSAALQSKDRSLSKRGPLGTVLTSQVARTTVEGAAGRLERAQRALDETTASDVIASVVAEYFTTPAAMMGSDGGPALLTYAIASFDPVIRAWQTVVSFPPQTADRPTSRRRAAMSNASLRALEVEVFGAGFDSARSRTPVMSLDSPSKTTWADDGLTLGDTLVGTDDPARTVEGRLELGELVARARLSKREREVIQLRAQDRTEAEIVGLLGLARGTVSSLLTRSRRKLEEALREPPEVM